METTIDILHDEVEIEEISVETVCPHCGEAWEVVFTWTADGVAAICGFCRRAIR